MKLLHLSPDGRSVHLYLTQGCRTTGYTTPGELANELNQLGHFRRRLVTQQWILPNACDRQTFLEEAAYQGAPEAQYALGLHYMHGVGGIQDYRYAYAWLSAAAEQDFPDAAATRGDVTAGMSQQELEDARRLAQTFIQNYTGLMPRN